jgi:uncharacterized protein (DUF302 family)
MGYNFAGALEKQANPQENHRENESYGFSVFLDTGYEEAIQAATEALKTEGFGVLTEIDVKETLRNKIGVDFPRYVILGACNPSLAYRALQAEPDLGLLLPCNVIVHEEEGGSRVAFVDPLAMLSVAHNPELPPVAEEARARLQRAAMHLKGDLEAR